MAYDPTVPNEANIVRTASGDLVKMQENFSQAAPLVSGTVVSGTAPSAGIKGFYLGDTTNRKRFFLLHNGTDLLIQRNVNTEASPSWQTVLTVPQSTGGIPTLAYKVLGVDPTASGHLATKGYVDGLTATLSGLTDTNVSSPASGEILEWDGDSWDNVTHAHALNDLTDVVEPSPASGEVLTYNGSQWEAASAQAGSQTLSGLTDTTITSPVSGAVLTWDGSAWIDGSAPAQTLSGLTDTTITSPATNSILKWSGSAWIDADELRLASLLDTTISSVTSGQHLVYNGSAWVNEDYPQGNRVICVLSGSQTQSIPQTTVTVMSGNEVPFNQGGFTVLSGTITIPDGITRVDIIGQVNWASAGVGQSYDAELYLGSSPLSGISSYLLVAKDRRRKSTDTDTSHQQAVAYDVPVTSGDTITLRVSQVGSAGGLNITAGTGLLVRESKTGGAAGGGGGGSSTLAGLTDTNITSPADGASLVYDTGSSKWIDGSPPASSLSGLTDTTITAPVSGASLEWDGSSAWIDGTPVATQVASGVGLVESFDVAVEAVASGDSFTISLYAFYPYDVETVRGKTTNGTCDLAFKVDSTYITGLSGITVSGTETGWDSSGSKAVALGNTLTVEVEDATTCSGLLLSVKTVRT